MKWSVVKDTSHLGAGGVGSKDKLIEATKSDEQNTCKTNLMGTSTKLLLT